MLTAEFTQGSFVEWSQGYKSDTDDYFFRGLPEDNPDNASCRDTTANHGWLHEKDFKKNNGFPDWVTDKDKQSFLSYIGQTQEEWHTYEFPIKVDTLIGYFGFANMGITPHY